MALTRTALEKFYVNRKPFLEEIIGKDFDEHPNIWSSFLNTKSVKTGWKDTATASGFGLFSSKTELEDAATDDPLQGPVARTTIVTYAKRNIISQEAIEDDLGDGLIASRLPDILRAGRASQEVLGHSLLNGGFGTATTPDGLYLLDTDHLTIAGGTYDNIITGADLADTSLEACKNMMAIFVDDRGIPINVRPQTLVVHPSEETAARLLLESPGGGAAGDKYDRINPYKAMVNLVVSPYLTDLDAFFLIADSHSLNFVWRVMPENWSEVNYTNSSVEVGVRFRCAVEALDPRGIVGSAGLTS